MKPAEKLRVACVQTNTTNDLDANCVQVEALLKEAVATGAEFISLPENAFMMREKDSDVITLYPQEEHPGVQLCQRIAKEHKVWIQLGSVFSPLPTGEQGKWNNRALLIDSNGSIVTHYDKIHLFDAYITADNPYQESARVVPGSQIRVADTPWGKLGMAICYDVRFPHLFRDLVKAGATMLSIPAAFAYHTGQAHWEVLLRARAIETGSFVIAPAQAGEHPGGKKTWGHSFIIGPWGEILAEGSAAEIGVISAELDLASLWDVRKRLPCLTHDREYLGVQDFVI